MSKEDALIQQIQAMIEEFWVEKDKIEAKPKPDVARIKEINEGIRVLRVTLSKIHSLGLVAYNPCMWKTRYDKAKEDNPNKQ